MLNLHATSGRPAVQDDDEIARLRRRQDTIFRDLHGITRRRDNGTLRFEDSVGIESLLVIELGQIQDRLNRLGAHPYDGCSVCRPAAEGVPSTPSWRT